MKILVTGAAGFIGSHVAEALLNDGHKVVAVDNFNDYYDPALKHYRASLLPKVQWHRLDISDYDALRLIFEREKFDKVCHLAAQAGVRYSLTHPHVYERSNALGTLNILECCRHTGVKSLVFASSSSVYGGNTKVPFSEDDRVDDPLSLYAQTKRSTELQAMVYARQFGLHCTALRFFSVYGPRGRPDMAAWIFAKNILEEKPIEVFNHGDMQRDWTFVADIVKGILLSLEKTGADLTGCTILNLGNNRPVKLNYFIELIEKELGKRSEKIMMPLQPGDVPLTFADITKAKELLDWEPTTSIEDGVHKFIDWFKEYHTRK